MKQREAPGREELISDGNASRSQDRPRGTERSYRALPVSGPAQRSLAFREDILAHAYRLSREKRNVALPEIDSLG